jgi:hypothetical protein
MYTPYTLLLLAHTSHSKLTTSDTFVKLLSFGGVAAKLVSKTSTQAIAAIVARGSLIIIIIIIVEGRCLISSSRACIVE